MSSFETVLTAQSEIINLRDVNSNIVGVRLLEGVEVHEACLLATIQGFSALRFLSHSCGCLYPAFWKGFLLTG
jgi:hypothetical protein